MLARRQAEENQAAADTERPQPRRYRPLFKAVIFAVRMQRAVSQVSVAVLGKHVFGDGGVTLGGGGGD
jgi:hypothetical protein